MKGIKDILLTGIVISLGIGYDMEDDYTRESKDWKGIVQFEKTQGKYSYGFWHSSQLNDGLDGAPEDQNILYIKRDFKL